jgi:hypothetical protein
VSRTYVYELLEVCRGYLERRSSFGVNVSRKMLGCLREQKRREEGSWVGMDGEVSFVLGGRESLRKKREKRRTEEEGKAEV